MKIDSFKYNIGDYFTCRNSRGEECQPAIYIIDRFIDDKYIYKNVKLYIFCTIHDSLSGKRRLAMDVFPEAGLERILTNGRLFADFHSYEKENNSAPFEIAKNLRKVYYKNGTIYKCNRDKNDWRGKTYRTIIKNFSIGVPGTIYYVSKINDNYTKTNISFINYTVFSEEHFDHYFSRDIKNQIFNPCPYYYSLIKRGTSKC